MQLFRTGQCQRLPHYTAAAWGRHSCLPFKNARTRQTRMSAPRLRRLRRLAAAAGAESLIDADCDRVVQPPDAAVADEKLNAGWVITRKIVEVQRWMIGRVIADAHDADHRLRRAVDHARP